MQTWNCCGTRWNSFCAWLETRLKYVGTRKRVIEQESTSVRCSSAYIWPFIILYSGDALIQERWSKLHYNYAQLCTGTSVKAPVWRMWCVWRNFHKSTRRNTWYNEMQKKKTKKKRRGNKKLFLWWNSLKCHWPSSTSSSSVSLCTRYLSSSVSCPPSSRYVSTHILIPNHAKNSFYFY